MKTTLHKLARHDEIHLTAAAATDHELISDVAKRLADTGRPPTCRSPNEWHPSTRRPVFPTPGEGGISTGDDEFFMQLDQETPVGQPLNAAGSGDVEPQRMRGRHD